MATAKPDTSSARIPDPPALCACGRFLGHRGVHLGSKREGLGGGIRNRGFAAKLESERTALQAGANACKRAIRVKQDELLTLESKLEALKMLEAAYAPGAKPNGAGLALSSAQPVVRGPFRIGERN